MIGYMDQPCIDCDRLTDELDRDERCPDCHDQHEADERAADESDAVDVDSILQRVDLLGRGRYGDLMDDNGDFFPAVGS